MRPLQPVHSSIYRRPRRDAPNMDRISMPAGMREGLTQIALDIFTDVANGGHSMQDALLAIYISGMQHALAARAITGGGDA